MSSPLQRSPARGVVCPLAAPRCRVVALGDIAGLPTYEGPTRRRRLLVRGRGHQAGRR
jgi:hypothetical protein